MLTAGLVLASPLSGGRAEELGQPANPVRISLVRTLFRDVPDSLIDTMAGPFGIIMSSQTGMSGKLVKGGDVNDLAQDLTDGKVHIGIFNGFEYGWARQKHPQLRPLVIAVNQTRHLKAHLVVKWDSTIAGFADLKEKSFNVPKGTRGHCYLFTETRCREAGQCPMPDFVGKITAGGSAEEALDEVVAGTVEATVVDNVALACYQRRKPGRFAELKVAVESEVFPAGVVVYSPGLFADKTLAKFRDGLLATHKSILGRQLLTLWKLTGFEPVPADYEQTLTDIVKAYPPPGVRGLKE
jgi:ABC-type phosphate/phosphonate transport system substrate-binding protein